MAEPNDAKLACLLHDLRSDDWKVVTKAQYALVQAGSVVLTPLCELLGEDLEVDWRITWVLGRLKDRHAVPYLSQRLLQLLQITGEQPRTIEDRRTLLLAELAEALGLLGSPEAAPGLCAALASSHVAVRKQATKALERIGRPAVPELCAFLDRLPADGIAAIAHLLARHGDGRAVPSLCAVLEHEDWRVRLKAIEALGALAPKYPVLALRAAIPHLERNQRGWDWLQQPLRAASKRTLRRIQAATDHLQHVPLPASSPPPDLETLPLPAGTHDSGDTHGSEVQLRGSAPHGRGWIERLAKWFRNERC